MGSTDFTQQDLDNLNDSIKKGVRRVEYNDRTVVYNTVDEMLRVRDLIRRCLGQAKRSSRLLASASKGTC